jgi:hypothetical protein
VAALGRFASTSRVLRHVSPSCAAPTTSGMRRGGTVAGVEGASTRSVVDVPLIAAAKAIRAGEWDKAEAVAIEILEATEVSGRNSLFELLTGYPVKLRLKPPRKAAPV